MLSSVARSPRAMVRAPATRGFSILVGGLLLIVAVAFVLRLPGLFWLQDVKPTLQFSLHPDEFHLLDYAANFEYKPKTNYVLGFTTCVYVVREIGRSIFNAQLDLVLVGRIISMTAGLMLLVLVGVIVYRRTGSTAHAVLSSAFLATMPLHVIQSDFAVVDSANVFFLYLSLCALWYHLRMQTPASLIWFAICIGVTMAFKFYVPLALPFAIVAFLSRHDWRNLALLGCISLLSFVAANFFSLTPWDFVRLVKIILFDNVITVAGNSPWFNLLYYMYELPALVGLGLLPFLMWGIVVLARELRVPVLCWFRDLHGRRAYAEMIRQPAAVIAATFVLSPDSPDWSNV
jgi:4-amino-4-deoxy-L-arabinose transferase-like glycosyltransferase